MVDNSNETYRDYSPFQTRKNAVLSSYFMSQAVQKAIHKSDTPPNVRYKRDRQRRKVLVSTLFAYIWRIVRRHLSQTPSNAITDSTFMSCHAWLSIVPRISFIGRAPRFLPIPILISRSSGIPTRLSRIKRHRAPLIRHRPIRLPSVVVPIPLLRILRTVELAPKPRLFISASSVMALTFSVALADVDWWGRWWEGGWLGLGLR
jgi:hypothetical protein